MDPQLQQPPGGLKRKRQRMMIAIAAGGLLALIVMASRRGADAASTAAAPQPQDSLNAGAPPTEFADNGAATAQSLDAFGQQISDALSGLSDVVDAQHGKPPEFWDLMGLAAFLHTFMPGGFKQPAGRGHGHHGHGHGHGHGGGRHQRGGIHHGNNAMRGRPYGGPFNTYQGRRPG
jgi:hypothetical protein